MKKIHILLASSWFLLIFFFILKDFTAHFDKRLLLAFFLIAAFLFCLVSSFFLFRAATQIGAISRCRIKAIYVLLLFFAVFLFICTRGLLTASSFPAFLSVVVRVTALSVLPVLYFLAAYGLGEKVFHRLAISGSTVFQEFLLSTGIGLGIFGYLLFVMALLKIAYPVVAWLLVGVSLLTSLNQVKKIFHFISTKYATPGAIRFNSFFLAIVIAILLLGGYLSSLANVLSGGWDTFHQYLTFPYEYTKNHGLVFFQFHPHWGFPQLGEMHFMANILLGGIAAPFAFNFFVILLSFLALLGSAEKVSAEKKIWLAAIFFSVPAFVHMYYGYLKIELLALFYFFLIFIVLKLFFAEKSAEKKRGLLVLLGIFLGLTISIKYTLLPIIPLLFLPLIVAERHRAKKDGTTRLGLKWFIAVPAIALTIMLPWLIKNIYYYKNPFYPVLPGKDFISAQTGTSCHRNFLESCKEDIPLHLEIPKNLPAPLGKIKLIWKSFTGEMIPSIQNGGPWFLLLLPLIFLRMRQPYCRFLRTFSLLYFFFWLLFFSGQLWYLFPTLAGLLVLFSFALLRQKNPFLAPPLATWISFWIFFVTIITIGFQDLEAKIGYVQRKYSLEEATLKMAQSQSSMIELEKEHAKKESKPGKEKKEFDFDDPHEWIQINSQMNELVAKSPEPTVIYGFMEPQGYFIEESYRRYIPDFFGYLFTCFEQRGDVKEKMRSLGVRYIFYDEKYFKFCESEEIRETYNYCQVQLRFRKFVKENNLKEVIRSGENVVYEL